MKAFRILMRSISESFKSVGRNLSLSVASISCIAITLMLVAVSIILSYNVNNFTSDIEKDMTIVVFVNKEATNEEVDLVGRSIENLNNIESVEFQSKDAIKEEMQTESDTFNSILSEYSSENNPLRDTYLIKVSNIEKIGQTANEIKAVSKVDVVKYGEGMVEELVKIFKMVKDVMLGIVIALIIVTAFLISNTIKITISNRKKEIEIMRLVGASNVYIKLPFFFEGLFLGLLGSILPIFVCCYGYIYLYNHMGGQLFTAIIQLVKPSLIVYDIIIYILIIGVSVGAIGSYRAVRRYLKI